MKNGNSRDPDRPSRLVSALVGGLWGGLLGLLAGVAGGLVFWLTLCVWDSVEDGRLTWTDPPLTEILGFSIVGVVAVAVAGAIRGFRA